MDAGSRGAAAFAAWRSAFVSRLAVEPVFGPLANPLTDDEVLAPWLDPTARIGLAVEGLVAADKPFGIDLPRLAGLALDDAAGHPATWGESHVLTPIHAFELLAPDLDAPAVPEVPCPATSTACAAPARCPASPTSAGAARSPATSGTSPTATTAAGWSRSAPPETRATHTTTTSSTPGPTPASCPVVTDWAQLTEETP